jgi:hypothetical protein
VKDFHVSDPNRSLEKLTMTASFLQEEQGFYGAIDWLKTNECGLELSGPRYSSLGLLF